MSSEKKGKSLKSKLEASCEMETPVIPMGLSMTSAHNDGSGCEAGKSPDIDLRYITSRGWDELTGYEFQFIYEISELSRGRLMVKRRRDASLAKYKKWLQRYFEGVGSDLDDFLNQNGFNIQAYRELLYYLLYTNRILPTKEKVEPCLKQALGICKRAVEKYGPKAEDKVQGARRDFVPLQEKPAPQQLTFSPVDYHQLYSYHVLKQLLALADFFPKKTLANVLDCILSEAPDASSYYVYLDDRIEELDKLSRSLPSELQDISFLQKVPLPKKYLDACEGIICTPFPPTESVMNLMTLLYNSSPSRTIPPLLKNLSKIPSNLPLTDCKIVEQDGEYYLDFTTGINKLLEDGRLRLNSALDKDLQGFTLYCTSYDPTKKLLIVSPVEYPPTPTHEFMGDQAFEEALALSSSGQVTVLDGSGEKSKVWVSNLRPYEEPNKKAQKRECKTSHEVQGF